LAEDVRGAIRTSLEEKFGFLFDQLNAGNTMDVAVRYAPHIEIHKSLEDYGVDVSTAEDTSDLAD
jgi:hypothetical protein